MALFWVLWNVGFVVWDAAWFATSGWWAFLICGAIQAILLVLSLKAYITE